ncbi:MAG: hypothetical protein HND42_09665 [Armatimonadetes bacterium]|nr:hypothetical protein [Armatimonadota bacterium]
MRTIFRQADNPLKTGVPGRMDVIRLERGQTRTVHDADSVQADWIGSGVAFVVYEARRKRGFVAHVLQTDWEHRGSPTAPPPALEDLKGWLDETGASPSEVRAVVAGGAQPLNAGEDPRLRPGEGLSRAVTTGLRSLGIDHICEDTGGSMGRSLKLNCRNGVVDVVQGQGSSTTHFRLGG